MLRKCNDQFESYILVNPEKHIGHAGGVFYGLAQAVIKEGGIVVGAAYLDDFSVKHIEIDNMDMLDSVAGVKFAESNIDEELKESIKKNLQFGRVLLFVGLPCQIQSIYRYLGEGYKNFYTVAVGCSGVISSKVWRDYIAETQSHGSIITEIYCPYRDGFGISQTKILIKFSHGTAYFRDGKEDKLLVLKNQGLIFKEECYQCSWDKKDLNTDIFLETYYENGKKDEIQEKGLTQVSVFSDKGRQMVLSICNWIDFGKNLSPGNNDLYIKPIKPKNYSYFWKYYKEYGFSYASNLILSQMNVVLQNRFLQKLLVEYAVLDAKKIVLEKILDDWGLEKVILYRCGVVGEIFIEKLKYSDRIYAIIDEKFGDNKEDDKIIGSDLPILIPPFYFIPDAIEWFRKRGIGRKRLLPINLLINGEYENKILGGPLHSIWQRENKGLGNIFLVTGAQFENKGAQSMLFVTVSELKKKYPKCDIYYLPIDPIDNYPDPVLSKYQFHIIRDGVGIYSQLYDLIPQLKAIIDVSGYALASKWNCDHFIQILLLAKNNKIPIYYMPQSFGPFDFKTDLDEKVKKGLMHATVIFAREKEGYDLLIQKYNLKNVKLSKDMVLQNREIIIDNVYLKGLQLGSYKLETDCNVGIIPNIRTYEFCSKDQIIEIYKYIIVKLLKMGKNIYIIAHSDDEQVCNDIYKMFLKNEHVFLYKKRLDCLEYSCLVREFQYIIASRYHAIIHSYKEKIPCIAIGWAQKYKELLTLFEQKRYIFDVRFKVDIGELMRAIEHMEKTWIQEKEKLEMILPKLQTENCFDVID